MKCNGSSLQGSWWQETPFEKISIANFGFFSLILFSIKKGQLPGKVDLKPPNVG